MVGVYDLSKMPTSFDFSTWCVIARTSGCNHVHFVVESGMKRASYPEYVSWRRFGNIVIPLAVLAGMTYSVGGKCDGESFPYHMGDVERAYQTFGRIRKLQPIDPVDKKEYVTITMRDAIRQTYRNSNVLAWLSVRTWLESNGYTVKVLNECEYAPLALEERMAIYAGAYMNLGVNNGPMALCLYSDAPYLMFNVIPETAPIDAEYDIRDLMERGGFGEGSQFSFRTDMQEIVWKPDTFDNIISAFNEMRQRVPA